jgi:hypothetical protein
MFSHHQKLALSHRTTQNIAKKEKQERKNLHKMGHKYKSFKLNMKGVKEQ